MQNSYKHCSYFDSDTSKYFFSRIKIRRRFSIFQSNLFDFFSIFQQVKRTKSERKKAIKEECLKSKGITPKILKQISKIRNLKGFSKKSLMHCHPFYITSSLFHVSIPIAIERSLITSTIPFFLPTRKEYTFDKFLQFNQHDDASFLFKTEIGLFVLVEGALIQYGLYDSDLQKPEHVIMIQHNTNIHILEYSMKSRWILEIESPIDSSNLDNQGSEGFYDYRPKRKNKGSSIFLKEDKQKENVLLVMMSYELLNKWVEVLNHEILRCRGKLLSNEFEENIKKNFKVISSNSFSRKIEQKELKPAFQSNFNMDKGNNMIEWKKYIGNIGNTTNSSFCCRGLVHDNSNLTDESFSEKIDDEIINTLQMFNLSLEKSKKNKHSLSLIKNRRFLSLFSSHNISNDMNRFLFEISESINSDISSDESSISTRRSIQKIVF